MDRNKSNIFFLILFVGFAAILFVHSEIKTEASATQAGLRRNIDWHFFTYAEPDFRAERLRSFPPQEVTPIRLSGDWALVDTAFGQEWVHTSANQVFINHVMPAFNLDEETMVGRINPQLVTILERRDNWLRVDSSIGSAWIDMNFTPPVHELENFMQQFGNTISVYYENMQSGFVFRHNAEQVFFGGSATKVNFALYIYHKTEQGGASMDSVHTYTSGDYWGGSGFIRQRHTVGASFTQRELLHLMITPSDNIATRILRRVHGLNGFRDFIESIGGNPDFIHSLTYSQLSADEAGLIMREIYRYIESGGRYSHEFRDNLLANRYPFIISDYPVASKSGWAANFGGAYHDMAIVYAPSPYVLAILSSRDGTASDRRIYENISMVIQEFNDRWFNPVGEGGRE